LRDSKPINKGNSGRIIEKCIPIIKLPMLRYESVFDFYSEEPPSISIQVDDKSNKAEYEQILRIRRWNTNKPSFSWTVYSAEREELNDIVVRKVIWDMDVDMKYAKEKIRNQKQDLLMNWPSITTQNNYIPSCCSENIIQMINNLDSIIKHGILLNANINPSWEWKDLELKRLYNWGQVHSTWSTNMKNVDVENRINMLITTLDSIENKACDEIQAIYLNYSIPPVMYKGIVSGES